MISESEIKEASKFHGHRCFGLLVGLKASDVAMKQLGVGKSKGEELVVFAENNSCAVDAIQVIAGATVGRGNLFVRDWGKHAYTFIKRDDGRAVRVSLRHDAFAGLLDREKRIDKLISAAADEVFKVEEVKVDVPAEAEVVRSVQCSFCKEPVMKTRAKTKNKGIYCLPCYEKVYIEPSG
jgi:formylmethanofuran dehydrogenase subunit E